MTTPLAGRPRVILLGASNLTRGISTVVRLAQAAVSQPAEFLIACGHGRSYGMDSTVLGRTLPGIAPCGLWHALRDLPPGPTRVLVTDVGNDLLYGARPEQIAGWVGACLAQLPRDETRITMTGLPLAALATLQPWRFALLSRVFFPLHAIRFADLRCDALELNDRLQQLAARHDATWIEPHGDWYGFDPIHIRMKVWEAAWEKILKNWFDAVTSQQQLLPRGIAPWWQLKRMRPAQWRMCGLARSTSQPTGILPNGSHVSMY
jgi:hypothetical protein